jgi:hypothetical protein
MRRARYARFGLWFACFVFFGAQSGWAEVSFRRLPSLIAGGESIAVTVSDDGSTVVGYFLAEGAVGGLPSVASRWSLPAGDVQVLQPSGLYSAIAAGVSADGSVVTGAFVRPESEVWFDEGYRWTAAEGMVPLTPLEPGTSSQGAGVSGDGNVIVGASAEDTLFRATVWKGDEAPRRLNDLGIPGASSAGAASFDGSTIVGSVGEFAAIWREGVEAPILFRVDDSPNPGSYSSRASDVTPDGKFVVGWSELRSFLYSDESGFVDLGNFEGFQFLSATAISADGRFIAGTAADYSGPGIELEALIRGPNGQWRRLEDLFASHGLVTEWDFLSVLDMTPDGRTFIGLGLDENGTRQGWAVTIPEPTSLALLGFGGSLLAIVNWRLKTSRDR